MKTIILQKPAHKKYKLLKYGKQQLCNKSFAAEKRFHPPAEVY